MVKNNLKKRFLFIVGVLIFIFCPLSSDPFELDWVKDGILLSSGVSLAISSEISVSTMSPALPGVLDKNDINIFDRMTVYEYSPEMDIICDVLQYTALAAPALLAVNKDWGDIFTIGVMYAESLAFAYGIKNSLKYFIPRYRPYMYNTSISVELIDSGDFANAFPSGHTTAVFTAAAFGMYVYNAYYPDSPYRIYVGGVLYTLAALTASLRLSGGNHFMTDVLAGAAIGSLSGFVIPIVHQSGRKSGKGTFVSLSSQGVVLQIAY